MALAVALKGIRPSSCLSILIPMSFSQISAGVISVQQLQTILAIHHRAPLVLEQPQALLAGLFSLQALVPPVPRPKQLHRRLLWLPKLIGDNVVVRDGLAPVHVRLHTHAKLKTSGMHSACDAWKDMQPGSIPIMDVVELHGISIYEL